MEIKTYQKYTILQNRNEIDACAKFMYRGYEISFSTVGYSFGGSLNEVAVFSVEDKRVFECATVEDAICWINSK